MNGQTFLWTAVMLLGLSIPVLGQSTNPKTIAGDQVDKDPGVVNSDTQPRENQPIQAHTDNQKPTPKNSINVQGNLEGLTLHEIGESSRIEASTERRYMLGTLKTYKPICNVPCSTTDIKPGAHSFGVSLYDRSLIQASSLTKIDSLDQTLQIHYKDNSNWRTAGWITMGGSVGVSFVLTAVALFNSPSNIDNPSFGDRIRENGELLLISGGISFVGALIGGALFMKSDAALIESLQ